MISNTFWHYFYTKTTKKGSIARGHDTRDRVHVNLLGDLLRLDLLVLSGDEHVARRLCRLLPPVLVDPLVDGVLVYESKLLAERLFKDVLVRDGDDVADELPDAVLEARHASDEVSHGVNLVPKRLELTLFQQVREVLDVDDDELLEVLLAEQRLALHEVGVGEVGERLEEDLRDGGQREVLGVELVQLEEGQVGLQVVGARVPRLHLHVALKGLDVFGIVALDALQHR